MEIDPRMTNYCRICEFRKSTLDSRIYNCGRTNTRPDFVGECEYFSEDQAYLDKQEKKQAIQQDIEIGKNRFMFFASTLVALSVFSIIVGILTFYDAQNLGLVKGLFRIIAEIALLFGLYNGSKIAKNLLTAFCIMSAIFILISISSVLEISLLGLILVPYLLFNIYSIYFLNRDDSFLTFFNSQNSGN